MPTEEDLIKKNPRQDINQQLTNIAGQSSFQDWITLKDRNAIPNNAPSLVWLDVKPGKRIQSQPFTINDEGMRVSYTNSYWNDPKRVARMHEVIDSAPQGWQAPEWLDVEGVENLYRYFEYRNPGKTWDEWGELPGDDPGIDLANYLDQPPQDVLHYDDMDPQYRAYRKIQDWYDKQLEAETKYQEAIEQNNQMAAQVIEQQYKQDLIARWDDLEPWQQFLMARDSITPIEGRPEWTVGTAAGWMGAKTALSIFGLSTLFFGGVGTLAAPGPGTAAGALAGLAAGAYTGYKAYMGEENEIAKILNVFNLPPELVERFAGLISMQTELASQGKTFADVGGIIPAWQASKSAYEAQTIPIGNWEANAVSKIANAINPEWSSGLTANLSAGEVWKFEQGYVVPQVVEGGTMAGEALLEATMRINNGEDVTFVYEDMVHKYGYSGTRADFIAQNFLDPMQFVPYIVNRGWDNIAGKVGDQVLREKLIEHRGSILIDALPMGWQQLATAIGKKWGWRSTSGIFDVLQDYGYALRNLTMASDGSYTLPENFSKFQIMVGQLALNKDGHLQPRITIPDSELATPTNRILKALDWAGRNTPETKAIMAQTNLSSAIDYILDLFPDNPMKIDEILHAIIDRDASKFQDIAGPRLASPEFESIRGALRDFRESKAYEHELKIWAGTQIKRQMLEELAVVATHDTDNPITAAKVMDMLRAGETDDLIDLIKTNPRTNNGIVAKYKHGTNPETEYLDSQRYISKDMIEKRLSTFIKGNVPWHPREFSARLMNKMIDHSTNYFIKRYDLKADSTVKRLSTLMKSTQSLYLLGLSPNFLVANAIDGMVTTSYYGVLGAKPLSQLDKFWVENELAKPARMGDAYGPGDVTHSIYTQLNPKDILSEAQSIVSKVNKNLGIFSRLSNNIERIQGANAITLGAMHYLKNNWTEGAGFGKMPADLEAKVRAAGIDPDTIYAMARSSKTPSDFDKKFYGAFREGTIGEALAEGAKRPKPPEGPAPTPEETLAKFDNAVKENADEFYTLDGQALTTELIDKTGVGEMIADNIRSGMDGDAAIGSALTMVKESLERQRWEDRLTRIESDNARMTAEGFKAAVEVFGEQIAENDFKSTALDFELTKEFDEVYRLKEMGLNTEANAWMVEVVEEVQRKIKIQAEENRLRIATLMNRLDPDNPLQLKISENLMQIGNAWEEFYANKVKLWEEFHETTRSMGWDEERYAVMKKELSDKLTTMAKDTRAFESGIQKNLDEYYVELIGRTDTQREKVRTWLSAVRNLEASRNEMKTDVFRRMAEDPANANKIYNEYMRGDYMPVSSKIQDAYAVGATRLTQEEGPATDYADKQIDKMLKEADIELKPQTQKPKVETPPAVEPKAKPETEIIKRDDTDTRIERTIYLDQGLLIERDTETRLMIRQLEDAYLERIKKAIPDMTNNREKQKLSMIWMRMRAETWAIDNKSTPLEYWRVYADIDNVKTADDALSNYIRNYNATDPEKPIAALTDIRQADGFIRATMRATKAANFETLVHEMLHTMVYMVDDATLDILAKFGGLTDVDEYKSLLALRDTGNLKADPELSKKLYEADEKIVEGAVRRMKEKDFGSELSEPLKGAFGKIRAILTNLWKKLKREAPELKFNDDVRKSMDTLILGSEEARRIYNDAVNNLAVEYANQSAGNSGSINVQFGDGKYYRTHYALVRLSTIREPTVSPELFKQKESILGRVVKFETESSDLLKPYKLSPEDQATVDEFQFYKTLFDRNNADQETLVKLQQELKELQGRPPFKGKGPQIDKLEADIKQHTPLTSKDYMLLQNLRKMREKLIPYPKGDTQTKAQVLRINESIEPLQQRLDRYGAPDARKKYYDLQEKVTKIQESLDVKESARKKAVDAYENNLKLLAENEKAIANYKTTTKTEGLEKLKKRVPPDVLAPGSKVPLISRDGALLYDSTQLVERLRKANMGTLRKREDINYTLDPERGDWVGEPTTGEVEISLFEDSGFRYEFTKHQEAGTSWEVNNLTDVVEYKRWLSDTQKKYGLNYSQEDIFETDDPYVLVLIPDVDGTKLTDIRDIQKVLKVMSSDDKPIVYSHFASELSAYITSNPNVIGQAYVAEIVNAMHKLDYWDPYADNMEGGWRHISDPRATKAEIEWAILSEREKPFLGIRSGVLDVLEYALTKSFDKDVTQSFVFNFIRKPINEFFESDRANATSHKIKGDFVYEPTEARIQMIDHKIHEMVSKTDALVKRSNDYADINQVLRQPFSNMPYDAQRVVGNQMMKFKANLDGIIKNLEAKKNTPSAVSGPYKWARTSDNNYEVSSQGDRRYSAFYAKLKDGRSIEEHYQVDYKGYDSIQAGKSKPPKNSDTPAQSYEHYKGLWKQYFDEKPALLEEIKKIAANKTLTDKFATTNINQARAIAEILNETNTKTFSPEFATRGDFENKGKGTPAGDGKDLAMRKASSYFVGEIFDETKLSSTKTSRDFILAKTNKDNNIVMLARNAEFRNKPLSNQTKTDILNHHKANREFVVGDMPGVDSFFVDYLKEIGAKFTVYHTGDTNRLANMLSTAPAPSFLQQLPDSFIYSDNHPQLKRLYTSKKASLDDFSQALADITTGKYDPDSELHQELLRAAIKESIEEPDIYRWLGVWKFGTHAKRIASLTANIKNWALDVYTAYKMNRNHDTSTSKNSADNLKKQYEKVAGAINRTKRTDLRLFSQKELDVMKEQLLWAKNTIDKYAKMRKDNDLSYREKQKIQTDPRDLIKQLDDEKVFRDANRGPVEMAEDTGPDIDEELIAQPTKVNIPEKVLKLDKKDLGTYNFTPLMMSLLEPEDIVMLHSKLVELESMVPIDQEIKGEVRANIKELIHEEYYKMTQAIQEKSRTEQPPAPPEESGYATQMMNNPTGSTPIPMMTGYAGLEVFDMDLYPLLSSIRDRMRKDMRSYKIDNLNTLDVDTRKAFQDWLNTTRINLAETRRNAVDWGIMQRDNALLNYSNRTNLDSYLEMIFPYQFWFTRSLGNWAKRMVSKPAMVGQMVRRQEMMKKNGEFWGKLPKRLQGKMVIPHAFSEPWMGNFMFINPWQNLYPPFNLLSSVNSFNMLANNVNPVYTLQDMVSEGQITQEEMDEAIEKQSGTNWDKAYARAIEENHADLKNPVTLASMMLSPSLWITEMFGDKPAENWPSTKTGTAVRALGKKVPGILGPVSDMLATALEAPEKFVRKNNFAYYGEYGDYKVNRMIANMVADGTFDYDRGMLAMINKSGPDYDLATQRLENELSMKVAGSALADTIAAQEWTQIPLATLVTLFPGGLYPIGEEEGMQLKEQMTAAWEELGKGNPYPINNFFNEHEGHLVRTGINDGPELQMKKFLAHNIREKYDALDPVNKGLVKVQLGEGFVSSLLSGSIDYEKLTKQDLTIWLDALGGKVPETEVIPQTQRVAPNVFTDGEVKEITTYLDMRERLYPNHAWLQQNYGELANEMARKKYLAKFPELKHYWDWNRKYKYDHPIIGEWSSYYGNSDVGTTYQDPYFGLDKNVIQGYLDEKRQRFPDLEWQQEVYFSLPTDEERYAFADANPSLIEAWDWDKAVVANNPTVEMYKQLKEAQYNMASNSPGTPKTPAQVSKNLALLDIHPFAIQELVIRHSTGAALSAGTKAELLRLFRSLGSPGGKLEDWIDSLF